MSSYVKSKCSPLSGIFFEHVSVLWEWFNGFCFLSSTIVSLMWYKSKDHFVCCCKSKCIVFIFRKDPHGFFAFPVTDAIAPGYSMIIKHPMDFGTMKEKIAANEYKSVTEFKVN